MASVQREKRVFRITGMDCVEEIAILKRELGPLVESEDQLAFDILNGKMIVLPGEQPVTVETIVQAVAKTGMDTMIFVLLAILAVALGFYIRHYQDVLSAPAKVVPAAPATPASPTE